MAKLLNYEELHDKINNRILNIDAKLNNMSSEELRMLLKDLLYERRLIIDEIDDIRLSSFFWKQDIQRYGKSMSLMVSDLEEDAYNLLQSKASRLGLSPGSLLNELMWKIHSESNDGTLPDITAKDIIHLKEDEGCIKIAHLPSIQITRNDLEKLGHRVIFSHINSLEFDDDIQVDLFRKRVKAIDHCNKVVFPPGISKLLAYAKAGFCIEYIFKENVI